MRLKLMRIFSWFKVSFLWFLVGRWQIVDDSSAWLALQTFGSGRQSRHHAVYSGNYAIYPGGWDCWGLIWRYSLTLILGGIIMGASLQWVELAPNPWVFDGFCIWISGWWILGGGLVGPKGGWWWKSSTSQQFHQVISSHLLMYYF